MVKEYLWHKVSLGLTVSHETEEINMMSHESSMVYRTNKQNVLFLYYAPQFSYYMSFTALNGIIQMLCIMYVTRATCTKWTLENSLRNVHFNVTSKTNNNNFFNFLNRLFK